MDGAEMRQLGEWLAQNFDTHMTKQAVLQKAQGSELPPQVVGAIADLPEGDHDAKSIISLVQEKVEGVVEMSMGADEAPIKEHEYTGP